MSDLNGSRSKVLRGSDAMLAYLRSFSSDLINDFEFRRSPQIVSFEPKRFGRSSVMNALSFESLSRVTTRTELRENLALIQIYGLLQKIEDIMPSLKSAKAVISKNDAYLFLRLSRVIDVIAKFARSTFKPSSAGRASAESDEEIQGYLKYLSGLLMELLPKRPQDVIHIVTMLRFLKMLEEISDLVFDAAIADTTFEN